MRNAPLPFARGAFGFAMCADAFQYIWTKRQLVGGKCCARSTIGQRHRRRRDQSHPQRAGLEPVAGPARCRRPAIRGLFERIEPRIFAGAHASPSDVVDQASSTCTPRRLDRGARRRPRADASSPAGILASSNHARSITRGPSGDPAHQSALRDGAKWRRNRLRARGFDRRTTKMNTAPAGNAA